MVPVKPDPKTASSELGYPIIEGIIDTEDFARINEGLARHYVTLEGLLGQKTGGLSRQKNLRKAICAFDLAVGLVKELLSKKYEIIEENKKKSAGTTSGNKKGG